MKTIGITGGIAAGKSTVTEILSAFPQIDADQIAREVVEPDKPGWRAVVAAFGPKILQDDKTLDRALLRDVIANDEHSRQKLNGILHPLIRNTIREKAH